MNIYDFEEHIIGTINEAHLPPEVCRYVLQKVIMMIDMQTKKDEENKEEEKEV